MKLENEHAIITEDLVKKYKNVVAVDGISLKVKKGEVFAFLGPNGAGKTTTVEILEGVRTKTSGKAYVLGYDIDKRQDLEQLKKKIGTLPQEFNTHQNLTVRENLKFWSRMYAKNLPIDDLIALVNLEEKAKERYKNLSGGLQRRLGIAIALVNDPELVFLDEPTTGLDPRARRETWAVIEGLKQKGKTVFLTTHYMEEAEVLADTVAIIHKGKIVALGSPAELIDKYGSENKIIVRGSSSKTRDLIHRTLFQLGPMETAEGEVMISTKKAKIAEVIDLLEKEKVPYRDIITQRPSLEDVFLNLTGERLLGERGDED
ncbi:MAG: ABC transporter ATP-binding protein [Candidatus Heimdallarchaeota archaeon]|nr:MAG: ABC transporter ATP-binding protein [Candidatus Heimdallarchaeota archaeon]